MIANWWKRLDRRMLKAVAIGTVLGTALKLAPIQIGGMVYSKDVLGKLGLIALAGVWVVPLEIEQFSGERTTRALVWTAAAVWAASTAILVSGVLPQYEYFIYWFLTILLPVAWAIEILVAFAIGSSMISFLRSRGMVAGGQRVVRVAFILLLIGLAAMEHRDRERDFHRAQSLVQTAFHRFGISVPPGTGWHGSYGRAAEHLSAFEHPATPVDMTISMTGDGYMVQAICDYRSVQIIIEGKVRAGKPSCLREAQETLRQCPVLKSFRFEPWGFATGDSAQGNGDEWELAYIRPKSTNTEHPERSMYLGVTRDGRLRGFIYLQRQYGHY